MPIPNIDTEVLRSVCNILADTSSGLTGTEIGNLLNSCGIPDPFSSITKRLRLFEALKAKQLKDRCANNVVAFIQLAMNPVRHVGEHDYFESQRSKLNQVLAFAGLELRDNGKIQAVTPVSTLTEAAQRADELRQILRERDIHPDVLRFCREELLVNNYFHTVFEATKSVAEKIRQKTGLITDGSELVDTAFAFKNQIPHLALNTLQTESEQSEQKGFMNLLKGLFGTFRNTMAHAPKITWPMNKQDALDILSLVSLVHRRIDSAVAAKRMASSTVVT
jgi:uncharacterized protein (TIGR02391 family)